MNKKFSYYAIIWAILLAVYNAVVFLVRPVIPGYTITYDSRFWIAWIFVILAFIGNLICAFIAFKDTDGKKLFYNIPLVSVSYTGLILMLIFGSVLMLIPGCPSWIAAIVCILILAFTAIAVIKAKGAAEIVENTEKKIKSNTLFIKSLTIDADSLVSGSSDDSVKAVCQKVYEAVRYSDPMSNDALAGIESQITLKFNDFANAVKEGNESIAKIADELLVLIGERNKKSKMLK